MAKKSSTDDEISGSLPIVRSDREKIAAKWSACYRRQTRARIHWWQNPYIIRHINQRVSGFPLDGFSSGLHSRVRKMAIDRLPFSKGISVGCGNARKEIALLREGIVRSFVLFELSDIAIKQGKELALKEGFQDRTEFILGDAFDIIQEEESFDFVHWNNSLHHMLDVEKALRWSRWVCKKGGMFYMDDYVGPNRFQWPEKFLAIASAIREPLPQRYLLRCPYGSLVLRYLFAHLPLPSRIKYQPRKLQRPDLNTFIFDDPSEAADSERILLCLKQYFPDAEIILTGGVIYFLALSGILQNFDEVKDKALINFLLSIDDACADRGETLYATALALK